MPAADSGMKIKSNAMFNFEFNGFCVAIGFSEVAKMSIRSWLKLKLKLSRIFVYVVK